MESCCIVIPVFNHPDKILDLVSSDQLKNRQIILVDDGSNPFCAVTLDAVAAANKNTMLVRFSENRGKGAAVIAGLKKAQELGYSHALQIDADGQHDLDDATNFFGAMQAHPEALILGRPIFDQSISKTRRYGRRLTTVWNWIETLSFEIRDSMCGYRVYPIRETLDNVNRVRVGKRMEFDTEIVVRLFWSRVPLIFIPTRVVYPVDGKSNFRMWRDNVLISMMHARLFFGMLRRSPRLLARHFQGRSL